MRIAIFAILGLAPCMPEPEPEGNPALHSPGDTPCGAETLLHLTGQPATSYDFEAHGTPVRLIPRIPPSPWITARTG